MSLPFQEDIADLPTNRKIAILAAMSDLNVIAKVHGAPTTEQIEEVFETVPEEDRRLAQHCYLKHLQSKLGLPVVGIGDS